MAQARGTSGKQEDKYSQKVANLNVKEEKKKSSSTSSSSSNEGASGAAGTASSSGGAGGSESSGKQSSGAQPGRNLSDRGYASTTNVTQQQIKQNNAATNNALNNLLQSRAQQITNTLLGPDATTVIQQTNTAAAFNAIAKRDDESHDAFIMRAYNALPTNVLQTLNENYKNGKISSNNAYAKEVLKAANTASSKYYNIYLSKKQQSLKDQLDHFNTDPSATQEVSYATAADYVRMQKEQWQAIYVEDGHGGFQDKQGVFTIGRDHLSGLPKDVSVVFVDNNGNWRYLATANNKASMVESLDSTMDGKLGVLKDKMTEAYRRADNLKVQLKNAEIEATRLFELQDKTNNPAVLAQYQRALERLITLRDDYDKTATIIDNLGKSYAYTYKSYEQNRQFLQGWSVEDEVQYQDVLEHLRNYDNLAKYHHASKDVYNKQTVTAYDNERHAMYLAAYLELSKRRAEHGNDAVFLNIDSVNDYENMVASMRKAVEQYNTWLPATLSMDKGETLGQSLRTIALANSTFIKDVINDLGGINMSSRNAMVADLFTKGLMVLGTTNSHEWSTLISQETKEKYATSMNYALDNYQKSMVSTSRLAKIALQEYFKAKDAYDNDKINLAQFTDEEKYIRNQCIGIAFNNFMSNMDIFDMFSVQHEYVAWKMAKDPELYSDDPKFKKLQEAYKEVYGTAYRGDVDAVRMAYVMLQIETGKFHDYIYLDGSDLRYADDSVSHNKGENYGFFKSMLVGYLTDVSNWVSGVKGVVGVATKVIGAKTLARTATDSLIQALTRSGVTEATAKQFAVDTVTQQRIRAAAKQAIGRSIKSDGDELLDTFIKIERDQFDTLAHKSTKEIMDAVNSVGRTNFLDAAEAALREAAPTALEQSLILKRGTVVAKTLHTLDDTMQDLQSALFKISNPMVAGSVIGLKRGIDGIKYLVNAKRATPELLQQAAFAAKQAIAHAAEMDFDTILSAGKLQDSLTKIRNEFYFAMLQDGSRSAKKIEKALRKYDDSVVDIFRGYAAGGMRSVANSYTSGIITELTSRLGKGNAEGLTALAKFANEKGFDSFDDMYKVIKENLMQMQEFSQDTKYIIKRFDNLYTTQVNRVKIDNINKIIHNTNSHIKQIRELSAIDDIGGSPFAVLWAEENPDLTQGVAQTLINDIRTFSSTMNPDFCKDAAGSTEKLLTSTNAAINTLEQVTLGHLDSRSLVAAENAVREYADNMRKIYVKNLMDWQANVLYDGFGKTNSYEKITELVPGNATGRDTVLREICDNIAAMCKDSKLSGEDIYKAAMRDENAVKKLDVAQHQLIYRITPNKGSNAIMQVSDKNMKVLTDALIDPNSDISKTIRLLADQFGNTSFTAQQALENASAMNACRIINDTLVSDGVDGVTYMAIMDALTGDHANLINSIVQTYSPDEATVKIADMIKRDIISQVSLHNGKYEHFWEVGANSVDVAENVKNISKRLEDYWASVEDIPDSVKQNDDVIDIFFSMNRTSDGAEPSDIAFYVRGSEDAPFALHRNTPFVISDGSFSARTYGKSAAAAQAERAALAANGSLELLDEESWQKQLSDYITMQKNKALAEGKSIRFIGFNSSNALTGNNKYLTNVLRSCGANINTSNAIDLADVLRMQIGEYVVSDDAIASLQRAIKSAIDDATGNHIALDIAPSIAYDAKYTCADILQTFTSPDNFPPTYYKRYAEPLAATLKKITDNIGAKQWNKFGEAMGIYVDADALGKLLTDGDLAGRSVQELIMQAVTKTDNELAMRTLIKTDLIEGWLDTSQVALKTDFITSSEILYSYAQRLNRIQSDIYRIDLITDADIPELKAIYNKLLNSSLDYTSLGSSPQLVNIMSSFKIDELSATQLFAVNRWIIERYKDIDDDILAQIESELLVSSPRMASYLSDCGYEFLCKNVVDYTDEILDPFRVKYLDTSELGYKLAEQLNDMHWVTKSAHSLEDYMHIVENIFKENGVYGTQDKLLARQSAALYQPIIKLYDDFQTVYNNMYEFMVRELSKQGLDTEVIEKVATQKAADAWTQAIREYGDNTRIAAVNAVLDLDEEALKAHLIRNCGGGLIIDPNAKCVEGLDLAGIFDTWKRYGIAVDSVSITAGPVKDRTVFRVYVPEVLDTYSDDLFKKYNHTDIKFYNDSVERMNNGMRHSSFEASDMTLVNGAHMDSFRKTFFGDNPDLIIDMEGRFKDWTDELYSCNMWTDADLKQLVNPYYTDDILRNIAQNTHQVRNNVSALHDFGAVLNNPYMNTKFILESSGFHRVSDLTDSQIDAAINSIRSQKQRLCVLKNNGKKFILVDYTDKLSRETFHEIVNNTICIDDGMYNILSDWRKSTNIAVSMVDKKEALPAAYKIYKDTIRSATIVMYLFGNVATGIRNMVDSSVKGINEVLQNNESLSTFFNYYCGAVDDAQRYSNAYKRIKTEHGAVNRETIIEYFSKGDKEISEDLFNILYGFEHTSGGDALTEYTTKELRKINNEFLMDGTGIDLAVADEVGKIFDSTYASVRYRGLSSAQLQNHMTDIHTISMNKLKALLKDGTITAEQYTALSRKFYEYHPIVESWGDILSKFPVLKHNQAVFNNAETRARLALYRTFLDAGEGEAGAMAHVTATQFNYAGLGHTEDFMPFTQYKLYNALYWFDHANARPIATAWRAAQYNDDGAWTADEISDMCAKYRLRQYFLYDKGADAAYDSYVEQNLTMAGHILLDGIDSYLGLPRELQAGNIDINGTHYIKLGNSFVEETNLVISCAVGAFMLSQSFQNIHTDNTVSENIRMGYDALKYTPLYDSFYNPWKAWIDLAVYAYDRETEMSRNLSERGYETTGAAHKFDSATIWKYMNEFVANKGTHSLAVAGIPVVGAILSNVIGRAKAFDLNLGQLMAVYADPDTREYTAKYINNIMLDVAGMIFPSLWGTKIEPDTEDAGKYNYLVHLAPDFLKNDPTNYFDMLGRLQKDEGLGFTEDEAKQLMELYWGIKDTEAGQYLTKQQYVHVIRGLIDKGYTKDEIKNLLAQGHVNFDEKQYLAMWSVLPGYLKYDPDARNTVISYYTAMGMTKEEAWAMLITHPSVVKNGRLLELTPAEVAQYNKRQSYLYYAFHTDDREQWTFDEWQAYWDTLKNDLGLYYPKGKWKETVAYLMRAGYNKCEAAKLLLSGFMLDDNGVLVDLQGQARRQVFSHSNLQGAAWDAYWDTVPNYTKYEKGAFGRTMKALKKMGYTDDEARAWIQMGIYVSPEGIMMNVTGMERPVLGYPSFNAYYQTLPDYIKYEKGAFKRTYAMLKQLGFDYDTSLRLIQQGAYLMDASLVQNTLTVLGARRGKNGNEIVVTDINTLLLRYGGKPIVGADGKIYMLVDCSGLQRPRKTYNYTYRYRGGGGGRGGRAWTNYTKTWKQYTSGKKQKYSSYYTRSPYITGYNESSYSGFTGYRGKAPGSWTKPYVTNGYVSTYSKQNFLNGASYGMRKVYKIDMRQYKSGALSTKRAYPAAYRNIAVAYRRNMYKDLYAKYGASRMMMRANTPGYSNASIVRLRRNEIYNRERYAERRDVISRLKTKKKG